MTDFKIHPVQPKSKRQLEQARLDAVVKKGNDCLHWVHLCKPRIRKANPCHFFRTVENVLYHYQYFRTIPPFVEDNFTTDDFFTFDDIKTAYLDHIALVERKVTRCIQNAFVVINEHVPKNYPEYFEQVKKTVNLANRCGISFYLSKTLRDQMLLEKLKS